MLTPEDRLDIHELYARYALSFDLRDVDRWLDTFTEDGSFSSPGGQFTGRDGLRSMADQAMRAQDHSDFRGYHWNSNICLHVDGDRVIGEAYLMFVRVPQARAATGPAEVQQAWHYRDEIVRDGQTWRFARRSLSTVWQ